jgi:hypothetical protein
MAVTLKIPFLWGVMPSAFVRGYTVKSVGGIFGLHIRDKILICDGKASWYRTVTERQRKGLTSV